ncbi:fatty acid--CoA ligase family protein [Jatrophihabitans sp.]|uniref:class I adenylate-forming enzyme family protein n=1 Tax=Jatrophihabitans sp. TaxID=1932789 RepID=UPI0030C71375|nr:fadK 5 [Jatrophihabitans sp.]
MSLLVLLEMAAQGYDDRTALGEHPQTLSYAGLERVARAGAAVIADSGAGSVAFVGVNGPVLSTLLFAAAAARVPFAPLNYRLADERILALVQRLDRPLVVVDSALAERLEWGEATVLTTAQWLAAVETAEPIAATPADAEETAVILFTSGTTGEPKVVELRHGNLSSYVFATVEFGSAAADDAVLVSVPPYHVAGVASTLSNIYAGRRMVHLPNFDAADWAETVLRERITSAMVVPTMLARIVEVLEPSDPRLVSLRSLAYGGAAIPESVLTRALELMPSVDFTNAYGLTETSSTITVLGPAEHRDAMDQPGHRHRLRSAGRAVPGIELEVRSEQGERCAPWELGELWVRGAQVSGRYGGSGSALDGEGWFPTRDLAELDADGFVYLHGRMDDTIIRGGENISPSEIEDVLRDLAGIRDVCVVGLADDEWGERTVAVVESEAQSGLQPDQVREYARGRVRSSLTPDVVLISAEPLPYSPVGKLLRRQVAVGVASTLLDVGQQP